MERASVIEDTYGAFWGRGDTTDRINDAIVLCGSPWREQAKSNEAQEPNKSEAECFRRVRHLWSGPTTPENNKRLDRTPYFSLAQPVFEPLNILMVDGYWMP